MKNERNEKEGIKINKDRLVKICLIVHNECIQSRTTESKLKQFLPQFNLPTELEKIPVQIETANPLKAAQYLFLLASMERKAVTKANIKNSLATYQDPNTKWIFDPSQVAERSFNEIQRVCKENLHYTLDNFPKNYQENCQRLVKIYSSDPRNIFIGKNIEQVKRELESFRGIGTGIANLLIHFFMDRNLAFPTDPKNALLKVDVHKGRIPLNTDCIKIAGCKVRRHSLTTILEKGYWEICSQYNLRPSSLDSALWVIGSEICTKKDYHYCQRDCPIELLCLSYVPENRDTSEFIVYKLTPTGEKVRRDPRKNRGQIILFK